MFSDVNKALKFVTVLVTVIAAVATLAAWWLGVLDPERGGGAPPRDVAERLLPTPKPVEPFILARDGEVLLDLQTLVGGWSLVFFGSDDNPDITPLTLKALGETLDLLAQTGGKPFQAFYVAMGPEGGAASSHTAFVREFHPAIRAVTGKTPQLDALARQFGAWYERKAERNGGTFVDHADTLFVVEPRGRIYAVFRGPHFPEVLTEVLVKIQQHHAR